MKATRLENGAERMGREGEREGAREGGEGDLEDGAGDLEPVGAVLGARSPVREGGKAELVFLEGGKEGGREGGGSQASK